MRALKKLQFTSGEGNPIADKELSKLANRKSGREMTEEENPKSGREMAEVDANFLDFSLIAKDTLLEAIEIKTEKCKEPKAFKKAYFHKDSAQRENWKKAIKKELHDMNRRGVWRHKKRCEILKDRRCMKCKQVFKIKQNGVYCARLVACRYTQIPGIDFTDAFSAVIHNTTWRILLICKILWNLHACLIDVETAFLNGDLTNDIYMDCPEEMKNVNNSVNCLKLEKCIYGLVQAARQFFRKLKEVLVKLGFETSKVDPCLLIKKDEKRVIFVGLYVDDCLCVGSKKQIENLKSRIQGSFAIKIDDDVKDYLSCELDFSNDRKGILLHQREIIESLEEEYGKEVS